MSIAPLAEMTVLSKRYALALGGFEKRPGRALERGQDAALASKIEGPFPGEGRLIEGDLLARGGLIDETGKLRVESRDRPSRLAGRADDVDVGTRDGQAGDRHPAGGDPDIGRQTRVRGGT